MWDDLLARQNGVVTRNQALSHGLTPGAIRHRLRTGTWQRLAAGVYATFSGPVPREAQLWAFVLSAGAGAVLSHESAGELIGLVDASPDVVHITVPVSRTVKPTPGVRLHWSTRVAHDRHPTRLPPQTRVEETVVDLTQCAPDAEHATNWIVRACARRLTTVDRLREALAVRRKLRYRYELDAVLEDVGAGCQSMVELAYLRNVERAHGLPTAQRQVVRVRRGGRWYDDVRYLEYVTAVEIDGQAAHPPESRRRDALRDNAAVYAGAAAAAKHDPQLP